MVPTRSVLPLVSLMKLGMFLKTAVSMIEAFLESVAHLVLQLRIRFYGEQALKGWVFVANLFSGLHSVCEGDLYVLPESRWVPEHNF